jgi:3-methylcrotonyl-CoA carboxylase beta subunit
MHAAVAGVTDHVADTETEAIGRLREIILGFGPLRRVAQPPFPPVAPAEDPEQLTSLVPVDLKKPYDVHDVITRIVDGSDFQEFKPSYGSSLVTAFARIHGFPVGILANNGVLFSESAVKGAHFIELCDQRHIPLLFLQNITDSWSERKRSAPASRSIRPSSCMRFAMPVFRNTPC